MKMDGYAYFLMLLIILLLGDIRIQLRKMNGETSPNPKLSYIVSVLLVAFAIGSIIYAFFIV